MIRSEGLATPVDDTARLAAFCQAEYPRLVGALTLYRGDPDLAHELASETVARICLNWRRVQRLASPGAWAHRVAMNLANSYFRRRAAERRALGRARANAITTTEASPVDRLLVARALAALPPRQRMATVLRYYSDLPIEEIAEVMGCSAGTVKSHLHKALANLRREPLLADMEEDEK